MLISFGLRGTLKFDFCRWSRSDIVHLKGALYGCKRAATMLQAAWAWAAFPYCTRERKFGDAKLPVFLIPYLLEDIARTMSKLSLAPYSLKFVSATANDLRIAKF
jgi:hypothetical protein